MMNLPVLLAIVLGVVMVALGGVGIAGYLPGAHIVCTPPDCPKGGNYIAIEAVFSVFAKSNSVYLSDSSGVYSSSGGFEQCLDVKSITLSVKVPGSTVSDNSAVTCGTTELVPGQGAPGNYTLTEQVTATFACSSTSICASTQTESVDLQLIAHPNYALVARFTAQVNGLGVTIQDNSYAVNETIFNLSIVWGNGNDSFGSPGGDFSQVYSVPGSYTITDTVTAQETVYPKQTVAKSVSQTFTLSTNGTQNNTVPPPPVCGSTVTCGVPNSPTLNAGDGFLLLGGIGVIAAAIAPVDLRIRIGLAVGMTVLGLLLGYVVGGWGWIATW